MSYTITPTSHPVALALANEHPSFVERARTYQWLKAQPTLPVPPTGWPPLMSGAFGTFSYWYDVIQRNRMHNPNNVPETNTLEEAVALALSLSAADPLLEFTSGNFPQWLTVTIANKDQFIRADRVTSWAKFAGSIYDVVIDGTITGRVHDAAFELKVTP